MLDHHIPARVNFFMACITSVILVVLVLPTVAFALTPIARWDVVPYQRIESGETFNAGVIAFSKAGINRVEFTVSGQGYSGRNPLVSSSMTYNERTDVYEYWVPLKGSDFSTNGAFTMQAVVYGTDGGSRTLETLPLMVDATGTLPQPKAWVSKTGSDATGVINNNSRPFLTLKAAVSAIQSANGGKSDGAIIYLFAGTYNLGDGSVSTTNEWLTITRDPGATRENTIINASGSIRSTKLLKVDGVTLKSQGNSLYVFIKDSPLNLWVNDSRLIGSGRWVANSNPVHFSSDTGHYSTNNYIYDADYAYRRAALVRGVHVQKIGNDAFENTPFVVNCTVDDIDNGTTGWHSDAYQVHTTGVPPATNRIIYNYKATNLHCEGVFMRNEAGTGTFTNNAFVNVFIELREPANQNESGAYVFSSLSISDNWDHLLIWNSTFLLGHVSRYATLTNSSIIGNYFYQFIDNSSSIGTTSVPWASGTNDVLYNHYEGVYGKTASCTPNTRYKASSWPCPHWYAKLPDSSGGKTATAGSGVLDLDDPAAGSYGSPKDGSVLIDRIPFAVVPGDIYNNPRDDKPDVGAIEVGLLQSSPPSTLSPPSGFKPVNP